MTPPCRRRYFQTAADKHCPDGMFNLGLCSMDGVHLPKSEETAVGWFNKSAQLGQPDAMFALAMCLREGRGCLPVCVTHSFRR